MSNRTISAALAGAFAASLALASAAQAAGEGMSKEAMGKEKCFGIATALSHEIWTWGPCYSITL